jgi:hypothetical protein
MAFAADTKLLPAVAGGLLLPHAAAESAIAAISTSTADRHGPVTGVLLVIVVLRR